MLEPPIRPTENVMACPEPDGAGVRPVTSTGWTVDQTSHRLVCDLLRDVLGQTGPGAEEVGSILYRASAVLYLLLLDHPIDQRGRCRSCPRPGAVIGFRRRLCRIHLRARYWLLRQPDNAMLLSHLADDPGRGTAPGAGNPPDRSSPMPTALGLAAFHHPMPDGLIPLHPVDRGTTR
ncbi:MAG: hypothetical protein ACRDTA_11625 [Pseudonocardiaceae bacterium]